MSLIDKLIDGYSAPEQEFTVKLPRGEEFRFRAITDYSELQKLKTEAQEFADMALDEKRSPQWKSIRPGNRESALAVFFIAACLLEPKLTRGDLLKLAKRAGWLVEYLFNDLNTRQMKHVSDTEAKQLDSLGEGSSATDSDETV